MNERNLGVQSLELSKQGTVSLELSKQGTVSLELSKQGTVSLGLSKQELSKQGTVYRTIKGAVSLRTIKQGTVSQNYPSRLKNAAANVLRETWLIYKNTKLVKRVNSAKVRAHQRKFLVAIYRLRKVKMDQRKLMDSASTITDMAKTQNTVYEIVSDMNQRQETLEERVASLEERLGIIQEQIQSLPETLSLSLAQHLGQKQVPADHRQTHLHPDDAASLGVRPNWSSMNLPPGQKSTGGLHPPLIPRAGSTEN
ncbi:small conductance calcium-activated potassium channel protein-like [Tachypleus tridentatus]|uniref:small conductance calcium-activated potassium channel protein-like n=1 Tax=Tachypleus tridentatus TaxID=6853 RepID=UPI003FD591E0